MKKYLRKNEFIQEYEKYKNELIKYGEKIQLTNEEILQWYDSMQKKVRYGKYRFNIWSFEEVKGDYDDFRPEFATLNGFIEEFERVESPKCSIISQDIRRIFDVYEIWFGDVIDESTFFEEDERSAKKYIKILFC